MVTGTPRMITDGLVLYVDMANVKSYPGSGTNLIDLTQNEYSASMVNGVTFSNENNGILKFDGTNDQVRIADNTRLRFTTAWTIGFWIRVGKVMWTYGDLIITKRFDGGTPINYQIYASSGSTINSSNSKFSIGAGGYTSGVWWGASLSGSSQELSYNTWYHITSMYSENTVRIYTNGQLITTASGLPNLGNSSAPVNFSGYGNSGNPFTGSLGPVLFYNRSLTDSEILQNFEATRERFGV
jgi:hypothetical protein